MEIKLVCVLYWQSVCRHEPKFFSGFTMLKREKLTESKRKSGQRVQYSGEREGEWNAMPSLRVGSKFGYSSSLSWEVVGVVGGSCWLAHALNGFSSSPSLARVQRHPDTKVLLPSSLDDYGVMIICLSHTRFSTLLFCAGNDSDMSLSSSLVLLSFQLLASSFSSH